MAENEATAIAEALIRSWIDTDQQIAGSAK